MDIEREVFDGDDTSDLPEEFKTMTAAETERRTTLLKNEVRVLREENQRLTSEQNGLREKIKENKEKIKLNNQLPYLVSNIVEVLEMNPENEDEEDGAAMDVDAQRQGAMIASCSDSLYDILIPVLYSVYGHACMSWERFGRQCVYMVQFCLVFFLKCTGFQRV
jgi:26S proteasome regulatory subunit T5